MIGEGARGADRRALDAKLSLALAREPVAELRRRCIRLEFDRDREAARAVTTRAIGEFGAAQAPAGREQRQRLEDIGLPRAIVADQRDQLRRDLAARLRVRSIVGERQAPQARRKE